MSKRREETFWWRCDGCNLEVKIEGCQYKFMADDPDLPEGWASLSVHPMGYPNITGHVCSELCGKVFVRRAMIELAEEPPAPPPGPPPGESPFIDEDAPHQKPKATV